MKKIFLKVEFEFYRFNFKSSVLNFNCEIKVKPKVSTRHQNGDAEKSKRNDTLNFILLDYIIYLIFEHFILKLKLGSVTS